MEPTMGFFKAPVEVVETHLCDWLHELKRPFDRRRVNGRVDEVLRSRLPLTMPDIQRYLLIPTDGPWTAYLDNLEPGTDASAIAYLAVRMRCVSVRCVAQPAEAIVLTVYAPEAIADWDNTLRDVRLFRELDDWVFREHGRPLPFEDTDAYRAPRIDERFTIEMLERYLRALGIRAFEQDFYLPPSAPSATLIALAGSARA